MRTSSSKSSEVRLGAGSLRRSFRAVRGKTMELCAPLRTEDFVVQSMPDVSPTKWHLAHTSWFFETFVLGPGVPGYRPFDERFALLFNSYYHAAGERHPRPRRGLLSRPTVEEVIAYRAHVDGAMDSFLSRDPGEDLAFKAELGLQHEGQHQELLLADIKHVLAQSPLEPAYRSEPQVRRPRPGRSGEHWARFEGGLVEIGTSQPEFAFDNERPCHRVWLEPFELARAPVRCGEYLDFMRDGGYDRSELWLSDGWDLIEREGWRAPLYWRREGESWRIFTLDGVRALDLAEPVCHLSYYEADAYAHWKGARLPLEQEWEHVAAGEEVDGNLLESDLLHPAAPVRSGNQLDQLFGDVWEWTSSPYTPYSGFAPFQGSIGEYNGKWMSNRIVLRGGSCGTSVRHARPSYRNFFGPESRWQFTGLRLARALD